MNMLILTRRKGEVIQIGPDIEITIAEIRGDQVKIGIQAPQNIEIHRKEVYLQIQAENEAASEAIADLFTLLPKTDKE